MSLKWAVMSRAEFVHVLYVDKVDKFDYQEQSVSECVCNRQKQKERGLFSPWVDFWHPQAHRLLKMHL